MNKRTQLVQFHVLDVKFEQFWRQAARKIFANCTLKCDRIAMLGIRVTQMQSNSNLAAIDVTVTSSFLTLTFFDKKSLPGSSKRAKIMRLFAVFDALEAAGPPAARRCENRRVAGRAPPVARRVSCAAGGARAAVRGGKVATSRK